ncbi:hypothetical protein CAOG_04889 [Capsaspora owczarzaki ATCC 30864]|uniref:Uncharacterized protein n=1 Tax=Capsaspora owczarzaki (strain ATCC 30864) TaxID=595528 RepID=A0A0D2UGK8_CAPO3|nr:hypothetical protein CAOG_04889 [Capsaspora owczarzaki ATCC 30864]KJE94211.1 hypothetical protein CAOG_004889 [Capsaspora owczarzaki ATCC 30864]|eukprot:XP_004347640.1 hypothetical protein CAOG_04889 [Capsaspora owczarzaki ATCC 30864]
MSSPDEERSGLLAGGSSRTVSSQSYYNPGAYQNASAPEPQAAFASSSHKQASGALAGGQRSSYGGVAAPSSRKQPNAANQRGAVVISRSEGASADSPYGGLGDIDEASPRDAGRKWKGGQCVNDWPFLVLFLLYVFVMMVLGIVAVSQGDPARLYHGRDWQGYFCGIENEDGPDMRGKPYLLFYLDGNSTTSIQQDSIHNDNEWNLYLPQVTLMNRPERAAALIGSTPSSSAHSQSFHDSFLSASRYIARGVCVASCPKVTAPASFPTASGSQIWCVANVTVVSEADLLAKISQGLCASGSFQSFSDAHRCIPSHLGESYTDPASNMTINATQIADMAYQDINDSGLADRIMSDLNHSYGWILLGLLLATALSLIWLLLLSRFAGCIIWSSIAFGLTLLLSCSAFCFAEWHSLDSKLDGKPSDATVHSDYTDRDMFLTYAIIFLLLTLFAILMTFLLRRGIYFATQIIKLAAEAVTHMPQLVIVPFLGFGLVCIVFAFNIIVIVHMGSAGSTSIHFTGSGIPYLWYDENESLQQVRVFQIIGFIWILQFIQGVAVMTIAGAVSDWLTCEKRKIPCSRPVWNSFMRTMYFHLGSIAFGSLVMVVAALLRLLISRVRQMLRKSKNDFAKLLLSCFDCLVLSMASFMEFVTRMAYVQMAISGEPFCRAGRKSVGLLSRNALPFAVVQSATSLVMTLGLCFIALTSALIIAGVLRSKEDLDVLAFPFIIMIFQGVLVVMMYTGVFNVTIQAIFLHYCTESIRIQTTGDTHSAKSIALERTLNEAATYHKGRSGYQVQSDEADGVYV